jgi:hypothetical protein
LRYETGRDSVEEPEVTPPAELVELLANGLLHRPELSIAE